jgi:hypothetical protein
MRLIKFKNNIRWFYNNFTELINVEGGNNAEFEW